MNIDLAFFDGDDLLCQGPIRCRIPKEKTSFTGVDGSKFELQYHFEDPACPVSIQCSRNGEDLYMGALSIGVHNSDDWESVNLGNIHTLVFRCHVD